MYDRHLANLKKGIIIVVVVMLLVVIGITVVATAGQIYHGIGDNTPVLKKGEILELFSYMLLIIIGLELLDTVYGYITDSKIHVETVLLIATTAVARELIVFDYTNTNASGILLVGIGIVLAGVATAYYLIKKVERFKAKGPADSPSE